MKTVRRVTEESKTHFIAGVDIGNSTTEAAIVQNNEGVLISNRVERTIPIVDEVARIEAVPIDMPAVVEVAEPGRAIENVEQSLRYRLASGSESQRDPKNCAYRYLADRQPVGRRDKDSQRRHQRKKNLRRQIDGYGCKAYA